MSSEGEVGALEVAELFGGEHVGPSVLLGEVVLEVGLVLVLGDVVELEVADVKFLFLGLGDEVGCYLGRVILHGAGLGLEMGGLVADVDLVRSHGGADVGVASLDVVGVVGHMLVVVAGQVGRVVAQGEVIHVLFLVGRVVHHNVFHPSIALELSLLLAPPVGPLVCPKQEVAFPQILSFQLS